jgi:hypothetical protein
MSLARPGLQALKEGPHFWFIGFAQEPVIHRDVLDFALDAGPTGLEYR